MTKSEWEALVQAFRGDSIEGDVDGLLAALLESPTAQQHEAPRTAGVESLVRFPAPVVRERVVTPTPAPAEERSAVSTVMQTIGMVTGVGPVVTGLLKLFGGGGTSGVESLYAPIPFSLPERVSVEAGLRQDRGFVGVDYGVSGVRQLGGSGDPQQAWRPAPQIQINVNAMDSRSFADHSDDIARAVREAMLRSHTLNDVIAEM